MLAKADPDIPPICPYCGAPSALVSKAVIYPHRPDLEGEFVWRCTPCGAWVGCHPGTTVALGRLADAELRVAKMEAHRWFDPMWRAKMRRDQCGKGKARRAAYVWLAEKLGIDRRDCHVGMFDVEMCARVVQICKEARTRA